MLAHEFIEAAEGIDRFLRTLDGLAKLSAVLKDVGGIVREADDAEKRLAALKTSVDAAQAHFDALLVECNEYEKTKKAEADKLVAYAEETARQAEAQKREAERLTDVLNADKAAFEQRKNEFDNGVVNEKIILRDREAAVASRDAQVSEREAAVSAREAKLKAALEG